MVETLSCYLEMLTRRLPFHFARPRVLLSQAHGRVSWHLRAVFSQPGSMQTHTGLQHEVNGRSTPLCLLRWIRFLLFLLWGGHPLFLLMHLTAFTTVTHRTHSATPWQIGYSEEMRLMCFDGLQVTCQSVWFSGERIGDTQAPTVYLPNTGLYYSRTSENLRTWSVHSLSHMHLCGRLSFFDFEWVCFWWRLMSETNVITESTQTGLYMFQFFNVYKALLLSDCMKITACQIKLWLKVDSLWLISYLFLWSQRRSASSDWVIVSVCNSSSFSICLCVHVKWKGAESVPSVQ